MTHPLETLAKAAITFENATAIRSAATRQSAGKMVLECTSPRTWDALRDALAALGEVELRRLGDRHAEYPAACKGVRP